MRSALLLPLGILSLALVSCGPKAPKMTFCIVDGTVPACYCVAPDGKQYDLTILECDKFIAQPPADAQKLRQYVLDLERKVASCR